MPKPFLGFLCAAANVFLLKLAAGVIGSDGVLLLLPFLCMALMNLCVPYDYFIEFRLIRTRRKSARKIKQSARNHQMRGGKKLTNHFVFIRTENFKP